MANTGIQLTCYTTTFQIGNETMQKYPSSPNSSKYLKHLSKYLIISSLTKNFFKCCLPKGLEH